MSNRNGFREFSGGLTVEDLREAWEVLPAPPSSGRWFLPRDVVDRLSRDWRRRPTAVRAVLGTLRKIETGKQQLQSDKSSLWDLTADERAYVFTGVWPECEQSPECQEGAVETGSDVPSVAWLAGIHGELASIEGLLREMVEIWRGQP